MKYSRHMKVKNYKPKPRISLIIVTGISAYVAMVIWFGVISLLLNYGG